MMIVQTGIKRTMRNWMRMDSLALHDDRANWDQENHEELDEDGPGGHVHAVLGPSLRRTSVLRELESTHARANKQDCKHGAECDGALCVLHCVADEVPLPPRELFHCDADPNHREDREELHREVDHTLHCHGNWRRVLFALGVFNVEH